MARKSKLNMELIKAAEKLLLDGNYQKTTAAVCGIDEATWYRWLREAEGAEPGTLKRQFRQMVTRASAVAESKAFRMHSKRNG